ncbi:hypothetical protein LNP26_27075 [Klebsiella variicola subsp. variicola]|nr:hypothetical protein [Klebsiella variicola subsp. variicola]
MNWNSSTSCRQRRPPKPPTVCEAVCIFVNDDGSRPVLEELKAHGVVYRSALRRI